jgi:hypothetical protein
VGTFSSSRNAPKPGTPEDIQEQSLIKSIRENRVDTGIRPTPDPALVRPEK